METTKLEATPRASVGKGPNHRLRAQGLIPATVYGKDGAPAGVSLSPKRMAEILAGPRGRNAPITLQVEGEAAPRLTLIKDLQIHPVKRTLLHVDLWQVTADRKVILDIPFETSNTLAIEKSGARVYRVRKDIKVECTPADIPAAVVFDMATCNADTRVYSITEIPMPAGCRAVYRTAYGLVQVREPKAALPETPAEGAAAAPAPAAAGGGTAPAAAAAPAARKA